MKHFDISLENGVLQVEIDKDNPTTGDRLVKDAEASLEELIRAGGLSGRLLKISGRMSLPVSYAIAHSLGHLYSSVAVFDPRLKAYVVVISTSPDYQLGDRLDEDNRVIAQITDDAENSSAYSVETLSFFVNLQQDDLLKVGFNPKLRADGDRIVRDTAAQLDRLIESGQLKGRFLKVSGRASVLASFVIANKLAHCYGAIALFEPKEGSQGLDRYIVSISHSPDYRVGQAIDFRSSYSCEHNLKIAICGCPGIGKTVLRDGLQRAIRQMLNKADDFLYVISGCPDGDYPAWVADTAKNDAELAYRLRKACQAQEFTPELARAIAQGIKAIKNPLLLFDVGGKITPENEQIMSGATHAVILAKSELEVREWQEFCERLNLTILAIIESDYCGREDRIQTMSPILKGSVHFLERGRDTSSRPTIQALARHIINLA